MARPTRGPFSLHLIMWTLEEASPNLKKKNKMHWKTTQVSLRRQKLVTTSFCLPFLAAKNSHLERWSHIPLIMNESQKISLFEWISFMSTAIKKVLEWQRHSSPQQVHVHIEKCSDDTCNNASKPRYKQILTGRNNLHKAECLVNLSWLLQLFFH